VNYRRFGRTGLSLSEIGIGTWGMGGNLWLDADDNESVRAIHHAIDLGVNFIDTALVYGNGHSEELVGRVLAERGYKQNSAHAYVGPSTGGGKTREAGEIYVATKIPPLNRRWPAKKGTPFHDAFTYDHIIASTEASLRNLKLDFVDLQQFHVWDDEWAREPEWQDAIGKLKEDRKIRFVGISMNSHESENGIEAAKSGLVDAFQVFYNIFDQSPERNLFAFCKENDIGLIARVPFDEGSLTGNLTMETVFADGDFRKSYFVPDIRRKLIDRAEELKHHLGTEASTLPELALRFVLHDAAVATVIPGMRTEGHVEANCAVSDGRRLSNRLLGELKKFHFYD